MDAPALPESEPSSISTLVERAARGDGAAEADLCSRFTPAIRAYASRRLRSPDLVDEFVQDVHLELLLALRAGSVREPLRLGGFVLGICRNVARERARSRERRARLWEEFGGAVAALAEQAPENDTYQVARLEDCLSQLGGRAREVVRLTYVEGESGADIAARLSVSEGNLRVLRHRTLRLLRECMDTPLSWEVS